MMFGSSIFLQRYLYWRGVFFVTGFQQETIWCEGVFFFQRAELVWLVVKTLNRQHTFFCIVIFSQVWSGVRTWLGIYSMPSGELRHHFHQFTKMAGMPRISLLFLTVIWFATVWVIWKERNNRVFKNTMSDPTRLIEQVNLISFLWLKSKQVVLAYTYQDWWRLALDKISTNRPNRPF